MNATASFVHVYRPAATGTTLTLLLLHGTGGDEHDLLALGRELAPGAGILSPRGQVLENGMPRFFRRLSVGVFDEVDLRRRTEDLAGFIRRSRDEYQFQKLVAVGYSNGANIAASLLLLQPDTLDGAALLRPMVPLVPSTTPDLQRKPVLIAAANSDPFSPAEETARLGDLLEKAGATVSTHITPGGHGLTGADVQAAKHWLAHHFAGSF